MKRLTRVGGDELADPPKRRCPSRDEDRDGFPGRAPVGRFPDGAARWGQLDIAGNVDEWVLTLPSTALQGDAATLGVQYGTSCGAESDTRHSEFVKAWPLPCGAIAEIRELGEDAHGGFRCAADLPAQAVDVR